MIRLHHALRIVSVAAFIASPIEAQDNILVYGNSIIQGNSAQTNRATLFFADMVEQSGAPRPNVVESIGGNGTTTTYLNNVGLMQTGIPANEDWQAVIIQGGTIETTFLFGSSPLVFLSNMDALANAFFARSPQGSFVGHETGADHPNSTRYPLWFPDPATWLMFPQRAYAAAKKSIDAAHPASPPVLIAKQGTAFAETTGYDITLFQNDLHHLRTRGQILCAALWYLEIYGGRLCDLDVDYAVTTPLVNRLNQFNITEPVWRRLAGYADRAQPRNERALPGTDSDFQMRASIGGGVLTNLCPHEFANVNDTYDVDLFSPLGTTDMSPALLLMQVLPTGINPMAGPLPGLQLERTMATTVLSVPDLTNASFSQVIAPVLSGSTIWLQALSFGPSGSGSYPFALSDAQTIEVQ